MVSKPEIPEEELTIFLSLGYKKEQLFSAYQSSEDKSTEGVLQWLVDHQHELSKSSSNKGQNDQKKLQPEQKNSKSKTGSKPRNKKKAEDNDDDSLSYEEEKSELDKFSNNAPAKKKNLTVLELKAVDLTTAIEMSSTIGNVVSDLEPNTLIITLLSIFTKWNNSTDGSVRETLKLLKSEEPENEHVKKIRNRTYQFIDKLMTMKIKKEATFKMKNFEKLLLLLSKLSVFDSVQSERLLETYPKFADRMGFESNDEIVYYLEQCAVDFEFRQPPENKPTIAALPDRSKGIPIPKKKLKSIQSKIYSASQIDLFGDVPRHPVPENNIDEFKNSKFREALEMSIKELPDQDKGLPVPQKKAMPKGSKFFMAAHKDLFGDHVVEEKTVTEYNEIKLREAIEMSIKESKDMKMPDPILNEKDLCIVCMDKMREMVNLPCAHFVFCISCGPLFEHCPICTKPIIEHLRIYWS